MADDDGALVAFGDDSEHPLAGCLKPGFRHCFCALRRAGVWILVDGRDGLPDVRLVAGGDFDLAGFWRGEGLTVVEPPPHRTGRAARTPLIAANCVGLVKATLGIRAPFALTPWRLYRHLTT